MSLRVERLTVGPVQANCYLVADEASARAVLIDPGAEAERLERALADADLTLEAVWLTHAHFDHVGALAGLLADRPTLPVHLHPADRPLLAHARAAAAAFGVALDMPDPHLIQTIDLYDDASLEFAGVRAHCLHTPGHAPGHVAFYLPEQRMVFAGDALFRGSIGRTDLPGGDLPTLLTSIRDRLLVLPPQTIVLPGHGPETTIATEAATNPFLSAEAG